MVYAKSAEGQTLACRYDAENLRYEIEENQELVRFIYNNQREVFTEVNANDTIRYIRGRNIISSDSVNAQTYYHYSCDEMGSITEVIDTGCSERTVLNHYQYDAFGNPIGNVAYSTSEIENYNIPEMKSHSKIGSLGKNGIKNLVDGWVSNVENGRYSNLVEKVDRNNQINPNGTLRINDTEYKIVENYNKILNGNSTANGKINIFSERVVCPSCEKVIKAFSCDYPNIKINVSDSSGNSYTLLGGKILN